MNRGYSGTPPPTWWPGANRNGVLSRPHAQLQVTRAGRARRGGGGSGSPSGPDLELGTDPVRAVTLLDVGASTACSTTGEVWVGYVRGR